MNTPAHEKPIHGIVTIHLPCQLGYLRIARQSIIDFCIRAGMSEYQCAQMEMAVDEACTNIIEHGHGNRVQTSADEGDQPGLRLTLIHQAGQVVVEIHDQGTGFDVKNQKAIPPEEYLIEQRERGLGMYIIKSFVDDLTYSHDPLKGNCLRLVKKV